MPKHSVPEPAILVLAGGRATRMGGADKPLLPFAGTTLLERVLSRMAGQGAPTLLSANGDPARFARIGLPVLADALPDHPGPLAGLLAGMEWLAAHAPATTCLVSVPVDTPFLPTNLIARLQAARVDVGTTLACAASGGRVHPVIGLWPVRLAPELRQALVLEGVRRVGAWAARHSLAWAEFPASPDPFLNINTPEELRGAEASGRLRS